MIYKPTSTYQRIAPQTTRIIVPLHHALDLAQVGRHLEQLGIAIRLIAQNESLNENERLNDAHRAIRLLDAKLKKELTK